jgi:sugar lactone lactonase YvrE
VGTPVQKLDAPASVLGEGPLWSDREQCLYFVDIVSRRLQAYWPATRQHRAWDFETYVGSIAECESGGLIVALGDRVVRFRPDPADKGVGALEELFVLERDRPLNRLNDGKVDPWGRFWVGSMRVKEDAREGRLWCLSGDGKARAVRDGIGVSNSIAFDRARGRMYFADSMTGTIERADLNAAGELGAWAPFAKAGKGAPDGSCTDADGYLWNAEWGGWRVCRYAPDGTLERTIEIPASRPSCCTFGGAGHRTLFVTTAQYNMTAAERAQDPNAGSLFSVELDDVSGLPADRFAI